MFFFIELATRRIHLAGITANPDGIWVAQQARQLIWRLDEKETPTCFLIRDNDRKYTQAFDTLFRGEGIHIIPIPYRAPNANSYAEKWIRTVREECLDHLLILNEAHLRRVIGSTSVTTMKPIHIKGLGNKRRSHLKDRRTQASSKVERCWAGS